MRIPGISLCNVNVLMIGGKYCAKRCTARKRLVPGASNMVFRHVKIMNSKENETFIYLFKQMVPVWEINGEFISRMC